MSDLIDRKQAIKAIEDLQDCYNGFSDTYDKACIIGVLEELPSAEKTGKSQPDVPDTNVGGMISRQVAIDAFFMELCFNKEREYAIGYKGIEKIINSLPSAEKTGKWIETSGGGYKCSVCDDLWGTEDKEMVKGFNYCPYCGTRMVD